MEGFGGHGASPDGDRALGPTAPEPAEAVSALSGDDPLRVAFGFDDLREIDNAFAWFHGLATGVGREIPERVLRVMNAVGAAARTGAGESDGNQST